jgi:hypothetical protein
VREDFPGRGGDSDIMSDMAPRPHFFCLPRFGENDPSTEFAPLHRRRCELNSGFTERRQARKGQLRDTRFYGPWANAQHYVATFSEIALAWVKSKR